MPIKAANGEGLKILTPKQILQRLPIAVAHVKTGNTQKYLINEIRQVIYILCIKQINLLKMNITI